MSKQMNDLALSIAATKRTIDTNVTSLKTMTDKLVELVGDGGETFTTQYGAVQVTQKTEDRLTDEFVVVFDQNKYMGLDNKTKEKLAKLGLVTLQRKEIKGQAPKVVVRLSA